MASDVKNDIFKKFMQAAVRQGVEASPYIIVEMLYKKIFDHPSISEPIKRFEDDDFPFLIKEKVKFKSGDNLLTGYFFNYKEYDPKKIVIFAHGYGNGFHRYLDVINYLAKEGFYVFSYDCTSFDESEGTGINGFPQGVVDLSYAVKYIKDNRGYKDEDIYLVGHSWGAYSVGAVINKYPHISKVVSMAGFNYAVDLVKEHGYQWAGEKIYEQIPYMEEHEKKYFKEFGTYKVVNAIKNSTTKFFFIHSRDDDVVPIQIGLELYQKECPNNDRLTYKILEGHGHTCFDSIEGYSYYESLKKDYAKYQKDKVGLTWSDKKHLLDLIVNKDKYLNMLDINLMREIVGFLKK